MSQTPSAPQPAPAGDALQFDTVEPAAVPPPVGRAPAMACAACRRGIDAEYYAVADKAICPACARAASAPPPGRAAGRLGRAALYGLGAGLAGALLWFVVRKLTHYEIGLIAILVGYMVGRAVLAGSGHRGGRGYQVLAIVLTYGCIAANYMPDVAQGWLAGLPEDHARSAHVGSRRADDGAAGQTAAPRNADDQTSGAAATNGAARPRVGAGTRVLAWTLFAVFVFAYSCAAPFLAGAQNIIGLLIIGFAVWEAWKLTRLRRLPITGPYRVAGVVAGARA